MKLLTIGIPTYNRKDSVIELICQICDSGLLNDINIIVIDDYSTDGTSESLKTEFFTNSQLTSELMIIRHEYNKGMAAGFIRMFEECTTDYLMMFADDDRIYADGVKSVINFLKIKSVDFLCTAWLSSEENPFICRGKNVTCKLPITEIREASNHAPGLVYKVSSVRPWLTLLKTYLAEKNYGLMIFPQVVTVLLQAYAGGVLFYSSASPGGYRTTGALTSGLHDDVGNHWASFAGRWREYNSFSNLFKRICDQNINGEERIDDDILAGMHFLNEKNNFELFSMLRSSIIHEKAQVIDYFDACAAFRVIRNPWRSTVLIMKYIYFKIKIRRAGR